MQHQLAWEEPNHFLQGCNQSSNLFTVHEPQSSMAVNRLQKISAAARDVLNFNAQVGAFLNKKGDVTAVYIKEDKWNQNDNAVAMNSFRIPLTHINITHLSIHTISGNTFVTKEAYQESCMYQFFVERCVCR